MPQHTRGVHAILQIVSVRFYNDLLTRIMHVRLSKHTPRRRTRTKLVFKTIFFTSNLFIFFKSNGQRVCPANNHPAFVSSTPKSALVIPRRSVRGRLTFLLRCSVTERLYRGGRRGRRRPEFRITQEKKKKKTKTKKTKKIVKKKNPATGSVNRFTPRSRFLPARALLCSRITTVYVLRALNRRNPRSVKSVLTNTTQRPGRRSRRSPSTPFLLAATRSPALISRPVFFFLAFFSLEKKKNPPITRQRERRPVRNYDRVRRRVGNRLRIDRSNNTRVRARRVRVPDTRLQYYDHHSLRALNASTTAGAGVRIRLDDI